MGLFNAILYIAGWKQSSQNRYGIIATNMLLWEQNKRGPRWWEELP